MNEPNPLIAERQDSTQAVTGIGIAESAKDLHSGIESGSWSEIALGGVGTGLEALSIAMDPLGTLAQYAVSWLIEHVKPLSDALEWLTGDADQIAAYAQSWRNVAKSAGEVAKDFVDEVTSVTEGWTGKAAEAYKAATAKQAERIRAASTASDTIGMVVELVGVLVGIVRELVRDLIAECVSAIVVRLPQWLAEMAGTLGIATPHVVSAAVSLIAKWVNRIKDFVVKLNRSLEKLQPLMGKLDEIWAAIKKGLTGKGGSPDVPASTTPAGPDAPASTTPSGTDSPASTNPSGVETTPTDTPPFSSKPDGSSPDGNGPASTTPSSTKAPDGSKPPSMNENGAGEPQNGSPADQKNRCGDPIDVATGSVVLSQTDVELAAALPMVLKRVHLSSYRVGRFFGPTWVSTLDQRLEVDERNVCFAADDGTLIAYPHPAPGSSVMADKGPHRPLSRTDDGGYAITDPGQGRTLHFAPGDSVLPLTTIADRSGHRIDIERDSAGTPLEVRHSGGYRIGVESDEGLVTSLSLRDGGGETQLVRYDYEDRRLTGVINASGAPLRFDYDEAGRITSWTDRNGAWYRYTYDNGRCVHAEGSGGFLSGSLEYDDVNRVTHWTDSLGQRTAYHLNESGQTIREVDPVGNETLSEWDSHDRLLSRTDALGRTVRYDYDESGNLTRATRPDGGQTLIEYNELRLPTTVVTPDGTVSHRRYDRRGNLTAVTDPGGATTTYAYDEHGHLSGVTDALGNTREVDTNAAGLPTSVVDPLGAVTRYERDGFGRVTAIADPAGGVTRFGWTVDGKPAWRLLPDGATERWNYDGEGNLRTHVDALGQVTETEVTHFDLPSAEVRPDGTRLEFAYDTELRLTGVTNEQGLVWRYDYDAAGNLVRETDFNDRAVTYRHDAAGQLLERTNGVGEATVFTRDVLGNVVERRSGSVTTRFAYDDVGRLLEAVDGDTRVTFQRDPLGRVVAESVNGRTVWSDYDALGRRITRRTPSGAESMWEYDANSRPVALHTAGRTLRFDHDVVGREVRRGLGAEAVLDQVWDTNHQLRSQSITGGTGQRIQQRSYTYREDGFLAGIDDQLAGPRLFDLDRGGRVTAVHGAGWTERYAYDAAGNVAQASWPTSPAAGAADAVGEREYTGTLIRRAGNVRYEHDAQGRVVLRQQKRLSHKPNTWRYYWDADDRLVSCLTPDGTYWRYRYDPLGRRVRKQRLTPDRSRVAEQVDFSWDGVTLAEQAHSDGIPNGPRLGDARVMVWNYEPGTFKPITQNERSPLRHAPQEWVDEQFYSIVTDLVGTPTELVNDHGGIAWYHHTTLWGTTLDQSRAGAYTPLRFPGQYHDPETGLNYNYHRHYDPTTGRYASSDPLGLAAGPNPHRYSSNPLVGMDPLGLMSCEEKIDEYRKDHQVGKGRNIAIAQYEIDDMSGELTGTSKQHQYPGAVPMFENPRFEAQRASDAEHKILEDLAQRLNPSSSGTIHITSERAVCPSCEDVIKQFRQAFPGIAVTYSDLGR